MMKGPSLEAIKKFKQLQEEKKRLEYDKKVKEKLTTLEHRAAHGDKKAKSQLKRIEKIDEDRNKPNEEHKTQNLKSFEHNRSSNGSTSTSDPNLKRPVNRPKQAAFDFDELMKFAANNTNEVRVLKKTEPKLSSKRPVPKCPAPVPQVVRNPPINNLKSSAKPITNSHSNQTIHSRGSTQSRPVPGSSNIAHATVFKRQFPPRGNRYQHDDDEDDEDEDDYYESDGFVVEDDDEEVQDELTKTLRTVFRYDKRRCDLREQELDRQYRAIGRVNTFEDLEREERRASKLAAAEDAEALRDLEERKRLKRQRLKALRE